MHQVDCGELLGRRQLADVVDRAARHAGLVEGHEPVGARMAAHGGGDQGNEL